ncbi:MAG: DMT family transporter [Bacteroidota bacterium]
MSGTSPHTKPGFLDGIRISSGVRHMLLATFWFSLMYVMVKFLAHLPTFELVFFRCGVATLLGLIALRAQRVSPVGSNRRLLFLRGLFGTLGLVTFFYTVQRMPMGTAVTIQYLSPVFTAILGMFILRERVSPVQWLCFALAFAGVLLIKGFSAKMTWSLLAIGIASAFFSGLAYNTIRVLREKEHPLVVVLHFQLFGTLVGALALLLEWETPAWSDWIPLLLMGVFTQFGQDNLTRSLQQEQVARVSLLNYLGVVYALVFGCLIFGEWPSGTDILGMAVVLGSVLFSVWMGVRARVQA